MEKPKDFDTVRAWGSYEPLPPGGYVCEIIGLDETMSATGRHMVKVALDIAEGGEKGRFMEAYRKDARDQKKWPNSAVAYQLTEDKDGNTHGRFKRFTDCVIDSNSGFEIVWGNGFGACFKGRLVGVVFGREQYEGKDGKLRWNVKPQSFETVHDIREGNFKIPEDRPVCGQTPGIPEGFRAINDEDIPF